MKKLFEILKKNMKPFVLGALSNLLAYLSTGCSGLTPSHKTQTMGVYALGLPAIAVITQTNQEADNTGNDPTTTSQANPVNVDTELGGSK